MVLQMAMLKRGYYVLIAGGAIFAAGLILTVTWALPLAEEIQRGTAILRGHEIGAGQSITVALEIDDMSKPLSIVISAGAKIDMSARVLDPSGEQIFDELFTEAMADATIPTVPGNYELVITNQSPSGATVDMVFGQIPGVGQRDIDTEIFSGVLTGLAITIAGIMVLIGGVVVVVLDRRK
jgi:hypothetical protein